MRINYGKKANTRKSMKAIDNRHLMNMLITAVLATIFIMASGSVRNAEAAVTVYQITTGHSFGSNYDQFSATSGSTANVSSTLCNSSTCSSNSTYLFYPGADHNTSDTQTANPQRGWATINPVNATIPGGTWTFSWAVEVQRYSSGGTATVTARVFRATNGTSGTLLFTVNGSRNYATATSSAVVETVNSVQPAYVLASNEYLVVEYWMNYDAGGDYAFRLQSNTANNYVTYPSNQSPTLNVDEPDGTSDTVTVGDNYSIQYDLADSDDVVTVAFYYDTNNSGLDGTAITGACATAAEGTNATCTWDTTGMTPGTYYVYGITNDGTNPDVTDYSPGQITINDPPTLNVDEPDGTGDSVTEGDNYSIQYDLSDSDDVVTVAFYYDTNNSGLDGTAITGACATAAEGTNATCTWDTTGMTAGTYYVYGITNDGTAPQVSDYSPGQITINTATSPTLNVDEPDGTGDTVTVGDNYSIQYDLADPDDAITAAFYYDTNNSGLDGTAITGACATAAEGTNATCTWDTSGMTPGTYYVYGIADDGTNPQVSDYSPGQTTIYSATAPTLNVDEPDGTGDTVTVGDNYSIQYDLSDSDDVVTVAFYYDTNNSGLNGTAITGACATAAEGTNATCTWDTTGMTAGTYYVYGITNDGTNPDVTDYSPGQITINAAPTLNVDEPNGTSDTVTAGDNYSIQYDLSDSDDVVTVAFYYDTDNSGLDGTPITGACAAAAEGTNATCIWDTTGMSSGTYYVYGIADDEKASQVTDYSPGQITINAAGSSAIGFHPSGTATGDNVSYTGGTAATALDSNDGNTSYGTSTGSSYDYYLEMDDHTTESGTINSVVVKAYVRKYGGGGRSVYFDIGVKTNGSSYFDSGHSQSSTNYSLYSGNTYNTNPQSGSAWTWSEIDSLVAIINHTNSRDMRATELYVEVDYDPNVAPTLNIDEPDGTSDTVTEGDNYSIQYDLADTDDVVTVAFYYDTNNNGLNGTAITGACATAAEGTNATCTWDTTGMTAGTYYVYGITNDGTNPDIADYSPGQITINARSYQPDAMIKLSSEGDGSYLTNDTYETTASAQVKSRGVASGSTATYNIKFQNDSTSTDSLVITGTGNGSGFTVQYLDDTSTDRTTDVTGSGYTISSLSSGSSKVWTLNITPSGDPSPVAGGTSYDVFVTATSSNDGTKTDQVKATTSSTSANLTLVKSADKSEAAPGDEITYTVTATNGASLSSASNVILTDDIDANTGFKMSGATFNAGTSTLTTAITYSNDDGSSWTYTPANGGCSAPAGYDYCVTDVKWTMSGNMPTGTNFNIGLVVVVK